MEERPEIHVGYYVDVGEIDRSVARGCPAVEAQSGDGQRLTGHGTGRVQSQHPSVAEQ